MESYAHDTAKPLPTLEHFKLFRDKYREIVDSNAIFDDPVPPTMGYTLNDNGPQPYYASVGDKGRGIFASRDIKEGELVHDGRKSDILFPTGMSWRKFIFSLPRKRACDMIDWTWTQRVEDGGRFKIFSSINISILCNAGDSEDEINVNPRSDTSSLFYALRDIKKDEELLTDYYIYDTVWDEVGL